MPKKSKKTTEQIIIFLLVETCLFLLAARVINFYQKQISVSDLLITIVAVLNFGIGIMIIKWLIKVEILNKELSMQKENLESTKEVLKLMRSERHDFINHLQSIYGLILTGEHIWATEYIKDMGINCQFNSQLLNIKNPALRILLQNKKEAMDAKHIEFKLNIECNLTLLDMRPIAITTVFGNLLDNCIDAVIGLKKEHRKIISFEISTTESSYCFFIQSSGPPIKEEVIPNIFKKGFSTKGTGRGYGLALVKKTVNEHGGRILYDLDAKGFSVILPKQEELL